MPGIHVAGNVGLIVAGSLVGCWLAWAAFGRGGGEPKGGKVRRVRKGGTEETDREVRSVRTRGTGGAGGPGPGGRLLHIAAVLCGRGLPVTVALSIAGGLAGLTVLARVRPDVFAALLPFPSGLVFYANLFPSAAAVAIPVAVAAGRSPFQRVRIGVLCVVLFGVSLGDFRFFLLPPATVHDNAPMVDRTSVAGGRSAIDSAPGVEGVPVVVGPVNEARVCLQSGNDTCSAAAVVSLLGRFGIETTEAEAARLAVTREGRGTRPLGVLRAVHMLTRDRGIPARRGNSGDGADPRARLRKIDLPDLLALDTPAILTVGVPERPESPEEVELVTLYNWSPGVVHDVVYLGRCVDDPGRVWIGEPQFGLERWPVETLGVLYRGFAVTVREDSLL